MPLGRPTKYRPEFAEQAAKLCGMGATNEDMADFFSVAVSTIDLWIKNNPTFSGAVKEAKEALDAKVVRSLYQRATGYNHPEDKIFNDSGVPLIVPTIKHYPPDATSIIFWLKNRQPEQWREKTEHVVTGPVQVTIAGKDASV